MNLDLTVESIMDPKRMEMLMIKDQPIIPPDSVIKTFSHIKAKEIEFALTQDKDGLAPSSFILKHGDWAKFFLDTWFDPLYRSYNFQRADRHALVSYHLCIHENIVNSY
jgi:mannan polymerase II complex MNN11 subunit